MLKQLLDFIMSLFTKGSSQKSIPTCDNHITLHNEKIRQTQEEGMNTLVEEEHNIAKPKYAYGKRSLERLETCHTDIQRLCKELIKHRDVTILEGHRTKDRQNQLREEGKSQLNWPHSRHNSMPSEAVDMAPYPIDWNDIERFKEFKEFVKQTANKLGIDITAGGDWKSFKDYPHYELKEKK